MHACSLSCDHSCAVKWIYFSGICCHPARADLQQHCQCREFPCSLGFLNRQVRTTKNWKYSRKLLQNFFSYLVWFSPFQQGINFCHINLQAFHDSKSSFPRGILKDKFHIYQNISPGVIHWPKHLQKAHKLSSHSQMLPADSCSNHKVFFF